MSARRMLLLTFALLTGATFSAPPALSQKVGTTGAVNPASTGTPPGGASRTLKIGADVVYQERIRTTGSGSLQVLFMDKTTLSVGPNSDLTIDEFVYNPNAGTGKFVASLARGSMRFVGGQISRNSGVTIKTPIAVVGIRGSVQFILLRSNGTAEFVNLSGRMNVSFRGETTSVRENNKLVFNPKTQEITQTPATSQDVKSAVDSATNDDQNNTDTAAVGSPPPIAPAPPFILPDIDTDTYVQDAEPPSPPEEPCSPATCPEPPPGD